MIGLELRSDKSKVKGFFSVWLMDSIKVRNRTTVRIWNRVGVTVKVIWLYLGQ